MQPFQFQNLSSPFNLREIALLDLFGLQISELGISECDEEDWSLHKGIWKECYGTFLRRLVHHRSIRAHPEISRIVRGFDSHELGAERIVVGLSFDEDEAGGSYIPFWKRVQTIGNELDLELETDSKWGFLVLTSYGDLRKELRGEVAGDLGHLPFNRIYNMSSKHSKVVEEIDLQDLNKEKPLLQETSKEELEKEHTDESTDTNSRDYEIECKRREDIQIPQEEPINEGHKANRIQTFFSLLKSFIGIGILATPSAFAKAGLIGAIVTVIIIGFLNEYSMRLLAILGEKFGRRMIAYGPRGASFVNVNIILSQVGFCIAYLLFIGEQLEQVVCDQTNGSTCGLKWLYILCAFLIVLPIVWLPSVRHLAYPALLANITIFFALGIILYQDDVEIEQHHGNREIVLFSLFGLPYFFGIAVFDFQGNGIVLNLRGSMKKPEYFLCLLRTVMIIVVIFLTTFCALSYEAYGQFTKDIITLNLPAQDYTRVVQILYCIGLLCTYPLMMIPAYDIIEKASGYQRMKDCCGRSWVKRILVRSGVAFLSALLAIGVPRFGLFINLTGAVCCTFLAFVLPGFFYRKLVSQRGCYDSFMTVFIIVFGLITGSISFVYTVIAFVQAFAEM